MSFLAEVSLHPWTEFADVGRVLEQCLADLGGIERFVRPGQVVVIKPNITANAPASSGGTTHVEIVEAIIRQVQRCSPARVIVAEGTQNFGTTLETAFPTGGWREMAARLGVELYNLDSGPHVEVSLENARYPHSIPFSKLVLDADVFISVPCLKTHLSADYTVALKNSYALTPQWKRSEIHGEYMLEEALVDLNRIRKPDLTVVDGWDGAEGIAGGIAFDRPAGARLMITGGDPVAVDVVSKEIMALRGDTRYLKWAAEDGVGVGDLGRIEVRGSSLAECRHPFMSPAQELCLSLPDVTIYDQLACSGCRIPALSILNRLRFQRVIKPLTMIFGDRGESPMVKGQVLVIGDCARSYGALGTYVPGCPPKVDALLQAVDAMGCICHKCRDVVGQVLAQLPEAVGFLSYLRVAASGNQVYAGDRVKRDAWHLELLVGDCMKRYAHVIMERAAHFGLDAERDIVWLKGCPVEADAVQQALARLQMAVHK